MSGGTEDRPANMPECSQRIETGYGKVYVEITYTEGDPEGDGADTFDIFVTTGQSGGFMNAWSEALGKTASVALRSGVDPGEVARQLMGIRMDKVAEDNGDAVLSIPDAVGIALKRHITGNVGRRVRDQDAHEIGMP